MTYCCASSTGSNCMPCEVYPRDKSWEGLSIIGLRLTTPPATSVAKRQSTVVGRREGMETGAEMTSDGPRKLVVESAPERLSASDNSRRRAVRRPGGQYVVVNVRDNMEKGTRVTSDDGRRGDGGSWEWVHEVPDDAIERDPEWWSQQGPSSTRWRALSFRNGHHPSHSAIHNNSPACLSVLHHSPVSAPPYSPHGLLSVKLAAKMSLHLATPRPSKSQQRRVLTSQPSLDRSSPNAPNGSMTVPFTLATRGPSASTSAVLQILLIEYPKGATRSFLRSLFLNFSRVETTILFPYLSYKINMHTLTS